MQRHINFIYILLILTSIVSCQSYNAKWDNDVVGLEKEIHESSYLLSDISQSEDANSDLWSGFAEGPFPKIPNQYSMAERLNDLFLEKYSKLEVSNDSIETIYRQVVVLENYFKYHGRDADFEKNKINQDILIQGNSESSHVLQYLLYKKFSTIKTNRYEEGSLNSVQSVLYADKKGRDAMLSHLHSLCEKHGYTLTAYMWSAKEPRFGSNKAKKQGTEALNYFLKHDQGEVVSMSESLSKDWKICSSLLLVKLPEMKMDDADIHQAIKQTKDAKWRYDKEKGGYVSDGIRLITKDEKIEEVHYQFNFEGRSINVGYSVKWEETALSLKEPRVWMIREL
jgi:hypothetical protein